MTDVAEIARGLTKAQREACLSAKDRQMLYLRPAGIYVTADRRVRYNLCRMNIIRDYLAPSQRLTDVGLAVRAHLTQEQPR